MNTNDGGGPAVSSTSHPSVTGPRVGLAFSGGGFRATCFGLGCLRALHDADVLRHVNVISGISGGSLIAAMYAYGPTTFAEFDAQVVSQLRRGIELEIILRALRPDALATNLLHDARVFASLGRPTSGSRSQNRADALRETLASRAFGRRTMECRTVGGVRVVISATDLLSMNAVRFGSARSACSAYGVISEPVEIAEAVAASAAFPLGLPAMERTYEFRRTPGDPPSTERLMMTDGGIYDNLGLSVLEPGRSSDHTAHVYDLDYIISCDVGQGRLPPRAWNIAPLRLKRCFDIVHRRAQNGARARMYEYVKAGLLRGVVHAYLGMDDKRLPMPATDLNASR